MPSTSGVRSPIECVAGAGARTGAGCSCFMRAPLRASAQRPAPTRRSSRSRCSGTGCRPARRGSALRSARGSRRSSASAAITMPGVQKPHCVPSFSWKACCSALMRPDLAEQDPRSFRSRGLAPSSQRDAGQPRLVVDQHRAGAALAAVAALLGAGQLQVIAQHLEQQRVVGHRHLVGAAVDVQASAVVWPWSFNLRCAAGRARAPPCLVSAARVPGGSTVTSALMPTSDLMWCATSRAERIELVRR